MDKITELMARMLINTYQFIPDHCNRATFALYGCSQCDRYNDCLYMNKEYLSDMQSMAQELAILLATEK